MSIAHASPRAASGDYVVRFTFWAMFQHAAGILLFGLLLLTGMPQKWPYLEVSRWTVDGLGGIFAVRWLHRMTGIAFTVLLVTHVVVAVMGVARRRMKPTILLERKDFTDAIDNLRYYLGWSDTQPRFGRYDYRQKFEYWGLIFGAVIMAVSGFILYFPIVLSRLLPAELIPAAKVAHSNEALLAFLIVLIWHMFGAHFSPESFPMDTSMFTGRIRKDKLKRDHPLEYEELFGRD